MADPFTAESVPAPGPAPTIHSRETEDMEIPYVAPGTPVTVTIEGAWDGVHNEHQPVMTYENQNGESKRLQIPHGALVQTKPEEVEAVEFTVDKTPKAAEPKLRTDTGEPLDTDDLEPLYQAANDREIAAMFPGDSPRKPEPGARVRVTYEAVYRKQHGYGSRHDGDFLVYSDRHDASYRAPQDAEVTVIEPARPAVPEEPKCDVEEEAGCDVLPWRYTGSRYCDDRGQCLTWERLWATSQEIGSKLYPIRYERGPVIGGE